MAEEATRTFKEMLLYKLDRTLAVGGIIGITVVSLVLANEQVALVGIGALGGFLGAKAVTTNTTKPE